VILVTWKVIDVARAVQQLMRNPNQQREMHQRSTQKIRINKQERNSNTIFNEVQQFAYALGAREILLIQQSITNYNAWGLYPFIYI